MSKVDTSYEGSIIGYEIKNNKNYLVISLDDTGETCSIDITALDNYDVIPPPAPINPPAPGTPPRKTVINNKMERLKNEGGVLDSQSAAKSLVDTPVDNHEHMPGVAHYSKHIFSLTELGETTAGGSQYFLFKLSYSDIPTDYEYLLFTLRLKNVLEIIGLEDVYIEKHTSALGINPEVQGILEGNIVISLVKKVDGLSHNGMLVTS